MIETDQPPFNNVAPFNGFQIQIYGYEQSYNFASSIGLFDDSALSDDSHGRVSVRFRQ